jgi:hypothetical protein
MEGNKYRKKRNTFENGKAKFYTKTELFGHSEASETEMQYLERWIVCTPLRVNVFVTLATQ